MAGKPYINDFLEQLAQGTNEREKNRADWQFGRELRKGNAPDLWQQTGERQFKRIPESSQLFAEALAGQQQDLPEAKGGTTRNVFDLGDSVAKVAKDPKGLQQNEAELEETPHTPQALYKGKDFVVTEKAQRDDKLINQFLKPLKEFDSEDFEDKNPKLVKLMEDMGLGNFLDKPLLWGDFIAARNWGIDKNGEPTLLDKGTLNDKIYEHDKAPKKVQSAYATIKKERRSSPMIVRTHRRSL